MNTPVLSDAQIAAIMENPQVSEQKTRLGTSTHISFAADIP
jgi:hypothetical protein